MSRALATVQSVSLCGVIAKLLLSACLLLASQVNCVFA